MNEKTFYLRTFATYALIIVAVAVFVKYFGAMLVALGLSKAAAVSISKMAAAIGLLVIYQKIKDRINDEKVKSMFRSTVNRRRAYYGF